MNRTECLVLDIYTAGCRVKYPAYIVYTTRHATHTDRRNYPTRLETRTKEFNWIASGRVLNQNQIKSQNTHTAQRKRYTRISHVLSNNNRTVTSRRDPRLRAE